MPSACIQPGVCKVALVGGLQQQRSGFTAVKLSPRRRVAHRAETAQCPDLVRLILPANLFRYPKWKLVSSCFSWLQIPLTRNL